MFLLTFNQIELFNEQVQNILPKITPSASFITAKTELLTVLVELTAKKCYEVSLPVVDVIPVGSAIRETDLPDSTDLDVFVTFSTTDGAILEQFANIVTPLVARELKTTSIIKYAENPYGHFQVKWHGFLFHVDLVATISSQNLRELHDALNISGMARTPFHNIFLKNRVRGLETEIRLFKYWLKQKRLYGVFSLTGFLTELLVIHFGSFKNILKASDKIVELILDFHGRDRETVRKLFPQALVVITDPIDPSRNAAAGIQGCMGEINLQRFRKVALKSLEIPNSLFEPLNLPLPRLELIVAFKNIPRNEDEIFSRLGRLACRIKRILKHEGFNPKDIFIESDKSTVILDLEQYTVSSRTILGPPIHLDTPCLNFKKKHKKVKEIDGRLVAEELPRYTKASDLILAEGTDESIENIEIILKDE